MSTALINYNVIAWARERAQIPQEILIGSLNKKYSDWESGKSLPTFKQATVLAKKLHIPLGYLFLDEVPEERKLSTDLRTRKNHRQDRYSSELQDVIADATRKQDWYRDYLLENGTEPLGFVGRFTADSKAEDIAYDILETLNLNLDKRQGYTKDSIITYISNQAEKAGICVLRNGKVGFNTHRPLNVDEFCGFSLPDSIAPFVFINTTDFYPAQLFTLIHELAHIWLGVEGVSDTDLNKTEESSDIEVLCDQVAVEVLVPEETFREKWAFSNQSLQEKASLLVQTFKVSTIVIARRALDMGLVSQDEFFEYYTYLKIKWEEAKKNGKEKKSSDGADFNKTFPAANSHNLTNAILSSVSSGNTLYLEGARLLGVKTATLANQARQRGFA